MEPYRMYNIYENSINMGFVSFHIPCDINVTFPKPFDYDSGTLFWSIVN